MFFNFQIILEKTNFYSEKISKIKTYLFLALFKVEKMVKALKKLRAIINIGKIFCKSLGKNYKKWNKKPSCKVLQKTSSTSTLISGEGGILKTDIYALFFSKIVDPDFNIFFVPIHSIVKKFQKAWQKTVYAIIFLSCSSKPSFRDICLDI